MMSPCFQVGDGDCGSTVKKAAEGFLADVDSYQLNSPSLTAKGLALSLQHAVGGTTGSLYVVLVSAARRSLALYDGNFGPQAYVEALQQGLQAVQKYGGAQRGHRTMLDALAPAADAGQQLINDHTGKRSLCGFGR